jgi:aspartate/methionine/tyrosine aminotransferase
VVASDEAYTELWWDEPPSSVLELSDLDNVLAFQSLSKRSGLTGYRSGFVAGDPTLIAAIRKLRAMAGSAPTEFVQRAAIAAWTDEEHVAARRAAIGGRRAALRAALARAGIELGGSRAGLFLWARAPGGDADAFARALIARGVAVVPGRYFGPGGEGWLRIAPVPDLAGCERAGQMIEEVARTWTS